MKKYFLIITSFLLIYTQASSQGCVAIRSTGTSCTMTDAGHMGASSGKGWQFTTNYRYFRSFRHFVGTEEQKQRIEEGTEVVNYSNSLDLVLTRVFNSRWSLSVDLPVISNGRSSLYEHGGARSTTKSFGLGDVRVAAYRWLADPAKAHKGNIQAGLGIKLPTGDYKYQDFFRRNDTTKVLGPVDQSIQLGDGGLGFTAEINAYYNFSKMIGLYGNLFYLLNPREHNGTSTARGGTPSATAITYGSSTMSVPDQYMARAGGNLTFDKLTFSAGMRAECLPVHDLLGGSSGFRRPGYIISAEPGVTYQFKRVTAYGYVPFALVRSRTQSVPDKVRTEITGIRAQGDAAFADYLVNVGLSFKF